MSQSHACMTLTNAARVNTPPLGALQFPCLAACGGVIDSEDIEKCIERLENEYEDKMEKW